MKDLLDRLKAALADRYTVERELGRGGMATVYLAEDLKHHRRVAIKVLDPDLAESLGSKRFLREIETVANLTHPHILPLHDSGEANGFLFYVMPYVKGESLAARLAKEKQLPVEDAVRITREIADALAYAHEEGVIHRDVKPANVMLEAGHAVLADFGVAHAVAEAKAERITRTGISLGTPAYMSPEQAAGDRNVDGRSDQYALGCVLFEMLAGHPPFTGAQVEGVVRQHLTERPPSVKQLRPSVAEDVVKVVNRALAKSPADRFRTAGEMAAALALTTSPAGGVQRRFWKAMAIAAGIVGAIVVGTLVVLVFRPVGGAPGDAATSARDGMPGIAIFPCENFSPEEDDAFYARAIHDEILAELVRFSSIRSIGRESVEWHHENRSSPRQMASALGVDFVGECSFQKDPGRNQIRFTFQLLDGRTETQLWAETYDRDLTASAWFAIQDDIAARIARAMHAQVGPEKAGGAEGTPTESVEALGYFLKGNDYFNRSHQRSDFELALTLYEQAVALDPDFASAHARIALTHAWIFGETGDATHERANATIAALGRARDLDPDGAGTRLAEGYYRYHLLRDWETALADFEFVRELRPGDSEVLAAMGFALRRLGEFERAIRVFGEAVSNDPLSNKRSHDLARTLRAVRRYEEAEEYYQRAVSLRPDYSDPVDDLFDLYLAWRGDLNRARRVLEGARARGIADEDLGEQWCNLARLEKNLDDAVADLGEWSLDHFGRICIGRAFYSLGEDEKAAGYLEPVRSSYETGLASNWVPEGGPAAAPQLILAQTYALLGLEEDAERLLEGYARASVDDAWFRALRSDHAIEVLILIGRTDRAISEIERELTRPSVVSVHGLRLDPIYDPLRSHPDFQALLEEYTDSQIR